MSEPLTWESVVGPELVKTQAWSEIKHTLERGNFIYLSVLQAISPKTLENLVTQKEIPGVVADLISNYTNNSDPPKSWDEIVGPDIIRSRRWDEIKGTLEKKYCIYPSMVRILSKKTINSIRGRGGVPDAICDILSFTSQIRSKKHPPAISIESTMPLIELQSFDPSTVDDEVTE